MPMLLNRRLRWKILASCSWAPINFNPVVIVPGASSSVIQRCGVTLLILRMRRIKQLVEVEILKNFTSFLFVLLTFKVIIATRSLTALMTAFLVRTDALSDESIILLVEVQRV